MVVEQSILTGAPWPISPHHDGVRRVTSNFKKKATKSVKNPIQVQQNLHVYVKAENNTLGVLIFAIFAKIYRSENKELQLVPLRYIKIYFKNSGTTVRNHWCHKVLKNQTCKQHYFPFSYFNISKNYFLLKFLLKFNLNFWQTNKHISRKIN